MREIREKKGLFQTTVAEKCDLSPPLICKMEKGQPVRWETIHLILKAAFRIGPKSVIYGEVHELWLKQRMAIERGPVRNKKAVVIERRAMAEFRKIIKGRSEGELTKILLAAGRAARKG